MSRRSHVKRAKVLRSATEIMRSMIALWSGSTRSRVYGNNFSKRALRYKRKAQAMRGYYH